MPNKTIVGAAIPTALFLLIGIGMPIVGIYGMRSSREAEELEKIHPNEPRLWRPTWRSAFASLRDCFGGTRYPWFACAHSGIPSKYAEFIE